MADLEYKSSGSRDAQPKSVSFGSHIFGDDKNVWIQCRRHSAEYCETDDACEFKTWYQACMPKTLEAEDRYTFLATTSKPVMNMIRHIDTISDDHRLGELKTELKLDSDNPSDVADKLRSVIRDEVDQMGFFDVPVFKRIKNRVTGVAAMLFGFSITGMWPSDETGGSMSASGGAAYFLWNLITGITKAVVKTPIALALGGAALGLSTSMMVIIFLMTLLFVLLWVIYRRTLGGKKDRKQVQHLKELEKKIEAVATRGRSSSVWGVSTRMLSSAMRAMSSAIGVETS